MDVLDKIAEHLKNKEVVLFLGPFFTVANGFPDFTQLIKKILSLIGKPPTSAMEEYLKRGSYLRAAEGCRRMWEESKTENFEDIVSLYYRRKDPAPGILYKLAASLPVQAIVTLSPDDVLQKLLVGQDIPIYSGYDTADALIDLKNGKRHLIQALGSVYNPEQISLAYLKYVKMVRTREWRDYFQHLFSNFISLFVGFEPNDAVALRWLKFRNEKVHSARPWYTYFVPGPNEEINMNVVIIKPEDFKHHGFDDVEMKEQKRLAHNQNFLTALYEKTTGYSTKRFVPLEKEASELWVQLNQKILDEDIKASSPLTFYRGRKPNWGIPAKKLDASRDKGEEIESYLLTQELRIALLIAPGGWGKTTVARRIAYNLWTRENFSVFWVEDPHLFPPDLTKELINLKKEDVLVVVDNACDMSDFYNRVKYWSDSEYKRLRFLLLGRTNEINRKVIRLDELKKFSFFKIFELGWLSHAEAVRIVDRLRRFGQLGELDKVSEEVQASRFENSGKGDLLASMLMSTSGKDLKLIMHDVCRQVRSWERGDELLKTYCIVAVIDSIGEQCTHRLLYEITELDKENIYKELLNRLPGELDLDFGRKSFGTRHREVALASLNTLFDVEAGFFDKIVIYKTIIEGAASINDFPEKKLTTIIPRLYRRKKENLSYADAKELFECATRVNPKDAVAWQTWAIMEKEQKQFRNARELFQKATKIDPNHAPSWQAWAVMEKELGNIDKAYVLLKKATEADPNHAPSWQAWAVMAKEQGRIEKAYDLFKRVTGADPNNAPAWQAWAVMEKEQKNIKKARKLFKKATKADPNNAPAWQAWALMENEHGNIIIARNLFQKSIEANYKHMPSWRAWIQMEKERGSKPIVRKLIEQARSAGVPHSEVNLFKSQDKIKEKFHDKKNKRNEEKEYVSWPYTPTSITDNLDFEQVEIISYLLAGLSQRLELPVLMVEFPFNEPEFIFPINPAQHCPGFCEKIYESISNGNYSSILCKKNMNKRAKEIHDEYQNKRPIDEPIIKQCHAGFRSIYFPFAFEGKIIGYYIVGKWEPNDEDPVSAWHQKRDKIISELKKAPVSKQIVMITRQILNEWKESGGPKQEDVISDQAIKYRFSLNSRKGVRKGLERITKAIAMMHEQNRMAMNRNFVTKLDRDIVLPLTAPVSNLKKKEGLHKALLLLREHIGSKYVGLFLSPEPLERFLPLEDIALPIDSEYNKPGVYLDRKAAKIPKDVLTSETWSFLRHKQDIVEHGILGPDASEFKKNLYTLIPFSILGHLGAVALGRLNVYVSEEQFLILNRFCFLTGLQLTGLYLLREYRERRNKELLGYSFSVHEFKKRSQKEFAIQSILKRFFSKHGKFDGRRWQEAQEAVEELIISSKQISDRIKMEIDREGALAFLREATKRKKIDQGSILSEAPTLIEPIAGNVSEKYKNRAKTKNMKIILAPGRSRNATTGIDTYYLPRIIENLLSNAVDYGLEGTEIFINWNEINEKTVRFEIRNTGETLNKLICEWLNSPGEAIDIDEASSTIGYGLSLVKETVSTWNGRIGVESNTIDFDKSEYQKHNFWFTMPTK